MARTPRELAIDVGHLMLEVDDLAGSRIAHGNLPIADRLAVVVGHLADALIELERIAGSEVESPASGCSG